MSVQNSELEIDWKYLSGTAGYKSLKAAYINDVQEAAKQKRPMRKKDVFLKHFQWVINRAKHYAYQFDVSIATILNEWEEERDYWWLNYYQDCRQPKAHSSSLEPIGLRGIRKNCKRARYSQSDTKSMMKHHIDRRNKDKSTKAKARWTTARKKRYHRVCKPVT